MTTEKYQRNRDGESKRKRHYIRNTVLVLVGLVLLLAIGGTYAAYRQFQPPIATGKSVDVTVNSGEPVAQIAADLEKNGLIRNASLFRAYVSYKHLGNQFQAGKYRLSVGLGIPEIIKVITHGDVVNTAVSVTIPEGYKVEQIADRLAEMNICSKDAFLQEVQHGQFQAPFLADITPNKATKYRLEGYLFPDTYDLDKGSSAHDIIQKMLNNFAAHVTPDMTSAMQAKHLTLPQVVTEASLIEGEARVNSERPIIASVIQNRMQRKMKLQIDATIEYILGHKNVLTTKDTELNNPYNTYVVTGLPPGPINSPGLNSINAVLHPASTSYLYYVVKNDGTGQHYFSTTYAEQLHNEALSRQNLNKHS